MNKKSYYILPFIVVILISISLIYYFIIYKSITEQAKLLLENKKFCATNAQILYDRILSEQEKKGRIFIYDYEYYYNKKLDQCFLSYGYGYDNKIERYVKDAYTNQNILHYGLTEMEDWSMPYDEFEARKKELFNQK